MTRDRIYCRLRMAGHGVHAGGYRRHRALFRRCDPLADAPARPSWPSRALTCIVLVTDLRSGVTATDQEVAAMLLQERQAGGALRQQGATRIGEPFRRSSMSSTTWVWATRFPSPRSTGTAPATCWTRCYEHIDFEDRGGVRRGRTSRWRSSASPTWARSSLINQHRRARSGSSSPTSPAPPGTPPTRVVENEHGKYRLHRHGGHPPQGPGGGRHRAATACCAPIWRWTGPTSASSSSTPRRASPSRTPRWQAIAHEQGKACIIAVNKWDAVEKDDKTMDEYAAKSWRRTSPSCPMRPSSLSPP